MNFGFNFKPPWKPITVLKYYADAMDILNILEFSRMKQDNNNIYTRQT